MTFWFDISNISTFKGGVVGIIRAELELAYNFAKIDPTIRFCRVDDSGQNIREVTREELSWLLDAGAPVEGFLSKNAVLPTASTTTHLTPFAKKFRESSGKMEHLRNGVNHLFSIFPRPVANILYTATRPIYVFVKKLKSSRHPQNVSHLSNSLGKRRELSHPFQSMDVVFAAGWMDNGKEKLYAQIKSSLNNSLHLTYLIYDTILINPETAPLYPKGADFAFQRYFNWVSNNCDLIFYGGETAKRDSQATQKRLHLPVPEGFAVRFGDTPNQKLQPLNEKEAADYLTSLKIEKGRYLLCVGTVEPRKNHDILYKAYREIIDYPENYPELSADGELPKLVIAGGTHFSQLLHSFKNDPKISSRVIFVRPTDEELDTLYKGCLFTVMPTLYEGWNLTLPESLSYGKFCISSSVDPMVEIGKDLIDYADPWDSIAWAKLIVKYTVDAGALVDKESKIKASWQNYSWYDCAQSIYRQVHNFNFSPKIKPRLQDLWFDLTLTKSWPSRPEGIPRVEISLAWELYNHIYPNIRFFEHSNKEGVSSFNEVDPRDLPWLHKSRAEYADFYYIHQQHITINAASSPAAPFVHPISQADQVLLPIKLSEPSFKNRLKKAALHLLSVMPPSVMDAVYKYKNKAKHGAIVHAQVDALTMVEDNTLVKEVDQCPFQANDTVLSVGIDWESKYLQALLLVKKQMPLHSCYLIHDMLPLLEPHFYNSPYPKMYEKMFYWVSHASDLIFCGGQTTLNDAVYFQDQLKLPHPRMVPLKLGVVLNDDVLLPKSTDQDVLHKMGINRPYLLSVGTIQIRKNHELLYRTLIKWLDETPEEERHRIPMFVFAGKAGWQVDHFMDVVARDRRVSDHLLIISPSDEELAILYRNCMLTLLPSYYEGAALPLSESLAYGKFCLTSDSPPLRETGQNFLEYIKPRDINGWLSAIRYYTSHPEALRAKEEYIQQNKSFVSWNECATEMLAYVRADNNGEKQ